MFDIAITKNKGQTFKFDKHKCKKWIVTGQIVISFYLISYNICLSYS